MRIETTRLPFALLSFLTLVLASCGSGGEEQPPMTGGGGFGGGLVGCIQPAFPQDQPDLSLVNPPRFLLSASAAQSSSSGQAVVTPGDLVEAEVTVNAATRRIQVELTNAWSTDQVIYTEEVETSGNETVPLLLMSDERTRGRFYMKLTLCGSDCEDRQVIFDVNPDVNSPYERTLVEDREVVRVDQTCITFSARPGIGSGTVLIQ
jgi:hypothetical protein